VVIVTVQNQYNSNVMKTIRGVERILDEMKTTFQDTFVIDTFYTQLEMIIKSIRNVSSAIILHVLKYARLEQLINGLILLF